MRKNLLTGFLILGIFVLLGVGAANAQTDFNGTYVYEAKNSKDEDKFLLTFEGKDAVYYSYFHEGTGTISGEWTLKNGIIKVVLTRGEESWTLKLKQQDNNLLIAENLPEKGLSDIPDFRKILPVGTIFRKMDNTPGRPELKSEEIGECVLKLVKSIHSLKDISPQNIEYQTGLKVIFDEKNRAEYGVGGNVTNAPNWSYNFDGYPYPSENNQTTDTVRFSFNYQLHEPSNPDTTVVCRSINFDVFSRELQQSGFSAPQTKYGEHGRSLGWNFMRNKVSIDAFAIGKSCINMIIISAN